MIRFFLLSALILPLAGCGDMVSRGIFKPAVKSDIAVGMGYRGSDDPCRRVGKSRFTEPYITRDEDLVACPVTFEGRPAFQTKTGGREVTRTDEWVIYRVPLLG